jgi:hypothetical protein
MGNEDLHKAWELLLWIAQGIGRQKVEQQTMQHRQPNITIHPHVQGHVSFHCAPNFAIFKN